MKKKSFIIGALLFAVICLVIFSEGYNVSVCGGISRSCACGACNPCYCCDGEGCVNGGNCVWYAWNRRCDDGESLPWCVDAKMWDDYATMNGWPVSSQPSVGAVAVHNDGVYGHVGYVASFNGSTIVTDEQSCGACGVSYGVVRDISYWDGGFILFRDAPPVTPTPTPANATPTPVSVTPTPAATAVDNNTGLWSDPEVPSPGQTFSMYATASVGHVYVHMNFYINDTFYTEGSFNNVQEQNGIFTWRFDVQGGLPTGTYRVDFRAGSGPAGVDDQAILVASSIVNVDNCTISFSPGMPVQNSYFTGTVTASQGYVYIHLLLSNGNTTYQGNFINVYGSGDQYTWNFDFPSGLPTGQYAVEFRAGTWYPAQDDYTILVGTSALTIYDQAPGSTFSFTPQLPEPYEPFTGYVSADYPYVYVHMLFKNNGQEYEGNFVNVVEQNNIYTWEFGIPNGLPVGTYAVEFRAGSGGYEQDDQAILVAAAVLNIDECLFSYNPDPVPANAPFTAEVTAIQGYIHVHLILKNNDTWYQGEFQGVDDIGGAYRWYYNFPAGIPAGTYTVEYLAGTWNPPQDDQSILVGSESIEVLQSITPVPTATPEPGTNGDVNGDNEINIIDALLVAQYYAGLNPTGINPDMADTNCDGTINIVDALFIIRYYVGLITSFPC